MSTAHSMFIAHRRWLFAVAAALILVAVGLTVASAASGPAHAVPLAQSTMAVVD